MPAHASSPSVSNQFLFTADEQSKQSFGWRLLRWMMARQQREADRTIMSCLRIRQDSYRDEFRIELERRLLGQ